MEVSPLHIGSALFEDVQMSALFPDGKTFVDCTARIPESEVLEKYARVKDQPGFDLLTFIKDHFELPIPHSDHYHSDASSSVEQNIEMLWPVLTRQPDKISGTLLPLPYPYIVPGGRFGEVYYWDSYFTMLGLQVSGKTEMLENMVKNFSYLIDTTGYIPNGNRTYFLGRSQPPFYSLMIRMLAEARGPDIWKHYLPELEKEYQFWMKGADECRAGKDSSHRVARLPDGSFLNRYWDENDTPRPESYRQDVELSHLSGQPAAELYRHLRAGAESGWDYSCRWFRDRDSFASIHTTDIIPVDLNCLLWHLESVIGNAYTLKGDAEKAAYYGALAETRLAAVNKYCWNPEQHFFTDYDWKAKERKSLLSLAGVVPLFLRLATKEQASATALHLEKRFLCEGGLVSTEYVTGQQWDAPNGWAPLQWMSIVGLEHYGHHELAHQIARRWITLNREIFKRTGKLMEKYNVMDTRLEAGGGEYAGQDGFGWTNGVFLALVKMYPDL